MLVVKADRRQAMIPTLSAALMALALLGSLVVALVLAAPAQAATASPAKFVPFGPTRLVDTRLPGQTAVEGAVADNTAVPIRVAGVGGVPTGISAVVVNLTVVNTTGAGYVQAFPTGQAAIGSSSNLNVVAAGQILSSLAVVPVGDGGRISVYQQRRADLVIDVFGYFTPTASSKAGRYLSAATPARLVDSRDGTGLAGPGKLAARDTRVVQVTGRGGVPASGVTAVAVNLTLTETSGAGFLTVTPDGAPTVSNVNVDHIGATRANFAIVPVDANGRVRLFTLSAAHVIVDVAGWFTDGNAPSSSEGLFVPVTPGRALDTRSGPKPIAGSSRRVTPAAALGVTGGVGSVVASLTATESTASGFLTAWPSGQGRPFTSSLNIEGPGQTVANAAIVGLAGGAFDIFTLQGAHLLADVSGYFQTSTPVSGDLVRWAYWGHLYADGQYDAGADTWTWNQSPYQLAESAARFKVAAAANGVQVQAKANGAYVTTTKPHPAVPDMRGRPNAEVQWFLAALIEDEGDRCGLVVDDPNRAHVDYVAQLLTQVGVSYTITSGAGGFWSLRATAASYPTIQSWPYATTARTPGIGTLPCQ
jgi:hypothetical protein